MANKVVDGKQLIVMLHVDDMKISHHEDPKVVDQFVEWCKKKHADDNVGKIEPSRGKVHDYLGIILDCSVPGKVKFQMKDYVQKMLDEFPYVNEVEAMKKVNTPATDHLFDVNPKAKPLDKK